MEPRDINTDSSRSFKKSAVGEIDSSRCKSTPLNMQSEFPDEDGAENWEIGVTRENLQLDDQQQSENEEEQPDVYLQRPLKSARREKRLAGARNPDSRCFFCVNAGDRDLIVDNSAVKALVTMLRDNLALMDTGELAAMIAFHFEEFRQKTNASLVAGQRPLPPMCARTVLEHIYEHTEDAEVNHILMVKQIKETRLAMRKSVLQRSRKTRQTRADKHQVDSLVKLATLEKELRRQDPTKWAYASNGARINAEAHKQGPVRTHTKTIVDYWRTRKQTTTNHP